MAKPNELAKLYRDFARAVCVPYRDPPNSDRDLAFRTYLEQHYSNAKKELSRLVARGAPSSEVQSVRLALFVFAAGLLPYGRLDVAEDIVMGTPEGRANMRGLAWSIKALMPLPPELDPFKNPVGTLKWLQDNRDNLTWDDTLQSYVFKGNSALA